MPARAKFLIGLVVFTVVVRVLPALLTHYDVKLDSSVIFYPWHFMPLMAVCLYSGATMTDRRYAIGMPLLALIASDLVLWLITGQSFWTVPMAGWSPAGAFCMATLSFLVSAFCYVIAIYLGKGVNRRPWPLRGLDAFGRGMLSEAIFFLLTNFVYFLSQTTDHPHTAAGLIACYVAAIPFAGRSFASTAFYSVLLFSPLAVRASGETQQVEAELPNSHCAC
jgi:hypothetical protein